MHIRWPEKLALVWIVMLLVAGEVLGLLPALARYPFEQPIGNTIIFYFNIFATLILPVWVALRLIDWCLRRAFGIGMTWKERAAFEGWRTEPDAWTTYHDGPTINARKAASEDQKSWRNLWK